MPHLLPMLTQYVVYLSWRESKGFHFFKISILSCQTCVNSLVGLQVGALGVDLVAAREVTMVRSPLFQLRVVSPSETIGF